MTKAEVQKAFDELLEEFETKEISGFNAKKINSIIKFSKSTKAYGRCRHTLDDTYTVYISIYSIADRDSTRSILAHEIIHTIEGCFNHGENFISAASEVLEKMGIKIEIKGTDETYVKSGMKRATESKTKYILKCRNCGRESRFMSECKTVKAYKRYYCRFCGQKLGKFELIKL